jgi:hypothetical protein
MQIQDVLEAPARCPCGNARDSKYAVPEREYTTLGAAYLLWGGTAIPTKVAFRCVKCHHVIETIRGSRNTMRSFVV